MQNTPPSISQIIVRITSAYPNLFENVHKYTDYLNHLVSKEVNTNFCLETITDGILYIYMNFSIFQGLNVPLSKYLLKKTISMHDQGVKFLLGDILNEANFPSSGIIVYYEFSGEPLDEMRTVIKNYFESYQCPEIVVTFREPNIIEVNFSIFHALCLYLNRLSLNFQNILNPPKMD